MAGNFYDKFPDEIIEFDFDATDVLLNGDTIQSVQVEALSGGIAIVPGHTGFVGPIVTFRVSGGNLGTVAYAVAKVTTVAGLFREGPLSIVIKRLPGAA
jgi:hypothetical protein